jgi:hypothetical protein
MPAELVIQDLAIGTKRECISTQTLTKNIISICIEINLDK